MNLTLITHLIAALAAATGVWIFQDARMDAAVAEVRLEQTNERLGAVSQARADERAITSTYQGALNAARTREALLRTEIDHLHRVSDGLRDQNADAARRLAAAPPAAVLEYALAASAVFNDCREAYGEMVEKADGHASDARLMVESWPLLQGRKN